MPVNFYELIGPGGKDEARNVFEKLIVQIVRIGHPASGIAPRPGDWGIDAIVGELDRGVSIWQAKYFIDGFGHAQHDQVRRSFQSALKRRWLTGTGLMSGRCASPSSQRPRPPDGGRSGDARRRKQPA